MCRIHFIENRSRDLDEYTDALAQSYSVVASNTVLQARDRLEGDGILTFDLVILDVMMPPLNLFPLAETNNGLSTGLRFFETFLRGRPSPDKPISVMLFTGASSEIKQEILEFSSTHKQQIVGVIEKEKDDPADMRAKIDQWAKSRRSRTK